MDDDKEKERVELKSVVPLEAGDYGSGQTTSPGIVHPEQQQQTTGNLGWDEPQDIRPPNYYDNMDAIDVPHRDVALSEDGTPVSRKGLLYGEHKNNAVLDNMDAEKAYPSTTEVIYHRELWNKKMDFLLSIIGYAVDLANVWRFPYYCYRNGGGAFLIPYFACLIFGALPLFFMELVLGQYHREGALTVWKIVPIFKGAGMAVCFMAYIVAFYYNVVIGWSFVYLFASFTSSLPWMSCGNDWNTEDCWQIDWNQTDINPLNNISYYGNASVSSTTEYFERAMLQLHESDGISDLGSINWKMALGTLGAFAFLYLGLFKGVKSSGKVVWVTATMPYVILTILLIRGVMLEGALEGIAYFITPRLDRLGETQAWTDAAVQIFFSMGAGFGAHIAFASYNRFDNNCYRDCLITAAVNSFTSIFSGFVIFSYLGYMAVKTNKNISDVATEGPGLTFVVYPEAIATLPGSVVWAIFFFFMMLMLGIDSAMGGLESVLTGVRDQFKETFARHKYSREIFTLFVVFTAYLFALPCTTKGGMYWFRVLDTYAAGVALLFAVLMQTLAVGWIYGVDQFCNDVQTMLGFRPNLYWRLCWKFFSPGLLLLIVIASFVDHVGLTYTSAVKGEYVFPDYANGIGWVLAASSMLMIPGYAIYKLLITKGTFYERFALCISPVWEHDEIRQKKYVKRYQKKHWLTL